MTSKKKKPSVKSFELTYLLSDETDMGTVVDAPKIEKLMHAKEKTTSHKKEHIKLILAEDGIVANKPIWWPPEKLDHLPYSDLKDWYTFAADQKRFCLDIASNERKKRRILLFKLKNPLELVILVEMLQNRNMYCRMYERDNITQVEYGSWVSTYSRDHSHTLAQNSGPSHGLGRTPIMDDFDEEPYDPDDGMYPERDYPEQFQDDRGLAVRNTCQIDYYDTEPGSQFIRNDISLMIPSYTERSTMLRKPDLYPNQWGKMPLTRDNEPLHHVVDEGLTESVARDAEYIFSRPGYNLVVRCITMLKHRVQPSSERVSTQNPPLSIRTIQHSILDARDNAEPSWCTIHLQPPLEEGGTSATQLAPEAWNDAPAPCKSTGWIYYKPEPMSLATVHQDGSRFMYVDTRA